MTPITSLDLTGFTEREADVWTDERGLVLSLHFFGLVPDLPATLDDLDDLRRGLTRLTAEAGAGLIEAVPGEVDALPAVRQLIKVRKSSGHGQVFLGSWTVPRATCSTVLKIQAAEQQMTGLREAVIADRVGPADYFRPHPYAPDLPRALPYHVADHEEWDAQFPDHPLTLVRVALRRITPTVTLHEQFKALPPFGTPPVPPAAPAPPATPPAPTSRRWFRRGS
ncbi:hypothetical protein [Kitasatospora sp. NPDC056181]|uniref:hypothetical protein n=1 Tax=Kitasatospora sp. NPDC056181 TaxID=3345737 RepID=UPI0035D92D68